MPRILVIDDNIDICILLKRYLTKNGYDVEVAHSGKDALKVFSKTKFDLVLCDYRLPDYDGLGMIQSLKKISSDVQIIIITGYSDVKLAVEVIKKGAFEYVTKPIHQEEILHNIKAALLKKESLENEGDSKVKQPKKSASKKGSGLNFVKGKGNRSNQLNKLIDLVAPTDMTVVICGESGTGKEVTAQTIHHLSKRKDQKMIAVDCGAIPQELAGSLLFGHIKGSFTGAITDKVGHFQAANKGTLFLDEIGNLSYENQIKLLRVLQERKIQKIGDSSDISIDVRVIVATNENLKEKVAKGEFREDLYYRLNEFNIELPSLRERNEDLKELSLFFLKKASLELDKEVTEFSPDVLAIFQKYNWPGNIRELKNVIKRATLMSSTNAVNVDAIPLELQVPATLNTLNSNDNNRPKDLKSVTERAEKEAIINALKEAGFNKSKTAKILNVDRKTLYNKISAYEIEIMND